MPRCTCAPSHLRVDVPTPPHPCVHPNLHLSPAWRIPAPRHQRSQAQAHQVHLHGALNACTQQCIPVLTHQHTGASRDKCTCTPLHPCKGGPNTYRISHKCVYAAVHLCIGTPNALTPCSHAPRRNTAVQDAQMDHMHSQPRAPTCRHSRCAHPAAAPVPSCTERPRTAPHSPPRRTCPGVSWPGRRTRLRRAPAPTGTSAWAARARGAAGKRRARPAAAVRYRRPWGRGGGGAGPGMGRRGRRWGRARGGAGLWVPRIAHTHSPGDAGEGPHALGEDALVFGQEGQVPRPFAFPSRRRCGSPLIPSSPPNTRGTVCPRASVSPPALTGVAGLLVELSLAPAVPVGS